MNDPLPCILFVDDELSVLSSLSRLFFEEPYHVLTASSPDEALDILNSDTTIHIVISDYRMPGMNGVELLQCFMARSSDTRRVILSAYSDTEILLGAVNQGRIHRYLTKPWNNIQLKKIIAELMEEYRLLCHFREQAEKLVQQNRLLAHSNEQLVDMVSGLLATLGASASSIQPQTAGTSRKLPVADKLSPREKEILSAVACGKPLKAIAQELGISLKTVSTYKKRLSEKMKFRHDADLISYALSNNYLSE